LLRFFFHEGRIQFLKKDTSIKEGEKELTSDFFLYRSNNVGLQLGPLTTGSVRGSVD
jgi:hypothetical protein